MSKRIRLSDAEIEHIIKGLAALRDQCNLDYAVVKTGKRVYQKIIDKLAPPAEPK